jgi:ABC-2 type transport system ATP-binding protein
MRRRLATARALLHDPELLILDEPTLGVDLEARHAIWAHVRSLKAQGHTVLLTTNYLDEAEALCDRVAILRNGRLIADDSPSALVAHAGRCVELDCSDEGGSEIRKALGGESGVLRLEDREGGVAVYLNGHLTPDELVRRAMSLTTLAAFRVRSPDLVEVFRALASGPPH